MVAVSEEGRIFPAELVRLRRQLMDPLLLPERGRFPL